MSGQNYTLWQSRHEDTNDDDDDVDDDITAARTLQLREPNHHSHNNDSDSDSGTAFRLICMFGLWSAITCCIGVILGYKLGEVRKNTPKQNFYFHNLSDYTNVYEGTNLLIKNINKENILTFVEEMSHHNKSKMSEYFRDKFNAFGYRVKKSKYWVTVSRPDYKNPNKIRVKFKSKKDEILLNPVPEHLKDFPPYAFYSPPGRVSSKVVFGNYGRESDFQRLLSNSLNINITGKILLIRLLKINHLPGIVYRAEKAGIAGILYYPDPFNFNDQTWKTFPEGRTLHNDSVVWANVKLVPGDPNTPRHPSINIIPNAPQNLRVTRVLVQPITAVEAGRVISHLGGPPVPSAWVKGLGSKYFGGEWKKEKDEVEEISMEINNRLFRDEIINIHAYHKAFDETKVIHIGCHFDKWKPASADNPGLRLGIFLELARALSQTYPHGLARQVIFHAWAGKELGAIGSYEYNQQHSEWIRSTSLGYLNVEEPQYMGKLKFFQADIDPLLRAAFRQTFQNIHLPQDFINLTSQTSGSQHNWKTFQSWTNMPKSQNDRLGFFSRNAISSFQLKMNVPDTWTIEYNYPFFHTQYDTLTRMKKFIDPDLKIGLFIASLTGAMLVLLSESHVIPMRFEDLAEVIEYEWEEAKLNNRNHQISDNIFDEIDSQISIFKRKMLDLDNWYSKDLINEDLGVLLQQRLSMFQEIRKHFLIDKFTENSYKEYSKLNETTDSTQIPTIESRNLLFGPDPCDPEKSIAFPRIFSSMKTNSKEKILDELLNLLIALESVPSSPLRYF